MRLRKTLTPVRRNAAWVRWALLVALLSAALLGQPAWKMRAAPASANQPIETGKFRLHKFEQPIGEESYQVSRDGDSLLIQTNFEFTDRGSKVPLTATLRARQDLTPISYDIKGKTARDVEIDTSVAIDGPNAAVREGKQSRKAAVPDRFFAISGYAPVTIQMMLLRYWSGHGAARSLKTLPGGEAIIEDRGPDSIEIDGKQIPLERYSISGVIWGREALWLDAGKQLVAAVTDDAEFDHFEAIREGYEAALPIFVARAAQDGMAALARLASTMSPPRKGALAIVGGTLVDATGGPAVNDSTVVVQDGSITAAGPRTHVKIPSGATIIDARGKTILPGLWDM